MAAVGDRLNAAQGLGLVVGADLVLGDFPVQALADGIERTVEKALLHVA